MKEKILSLDPTADLADIFSYVKSRFHWCVRNKILTPEVIDSNRELFADNGILHNQNGENAHILVTGKMLVTGRNSYIRATQSAKVIAIDSHVRAFDDTVVKTTGNSTVKAHDDSVVHGNDGTIIFLYDNAILKGYCYNVYDYRKTI